LTTRTKTPSWVAPSSVPAACSASELGQDQQVPLGHPPPARQAAVRADADELGAPVLEQRALALGVREALVEARAREAVRDRRLPAEVVGQQRVRQRLAQAGVELVVDDREVVGVERGADPRSRRAAGAVVATAAEDQREGQQREQGAAHCGAL